MSKLVVLKNCYADDSPELTVLKSKFNRFATLLNRQSHILPAEEQHEMHILLTRIEEKINLLLGRT